MDLLTWPDGPENPKIFKRFYSDSAYEWYYGVNPVIRLKANPLFFLHLYPLNHVTYFLLFVPLGKNPPLYPVSRTQTAFSCLLFPDPGNFGPL